MNKEVDELIQEYAAQGGNPQDWRPSYNVAPQQNVPIVRDWVDKDNGEQHRELELAKWGFRPQWMTDTKKPAPINARLEGVATNGLFRKAFAARRALVPMIGYFEWEETPHGKQPHFIHSDGLLSAAAVVAPVKNDETGEWSHTFAIITREARDASGEVHDRMPVFLTPDQWETWLQPVPLDGADQQRVMLDMLDQTSEHVATTITTYPVSQRVNSVRGKNAGDPADPTLIEPVTAEST